MTRRREARRLAFFNLQPAEWKYAKHVRLTMAVGGEEDDRQVAMSEQPRDLEGLYRRYKGLLRYIAARKFRVPDEDVEPLIREALIAVHERGRAVDSFERSLVAAVCNVARHYRRHHAQGAE